MILSTPGATALQMWRRLETYTIDLHHADTNDANWVNVCNVSGRGILVAIGFTCGTAGEPMYFEVTIDGTKEIDGTDAFFVEETSITFPLMVGFDTSCLVRMKAAGAVAGDYYAVTLTE